jgi:hypothetical protein
MPRHGGCDGLHPSSTVRQHAGSKRVFNTEYGKASRKAVGTDAVANMHRSLDKEVEEFLGGAQNCRQTVS